MQLRIRYIIIATGLILLGFFYFFSRNVKADPVKNTDFSVTVRVQEKIDKSEHLRISALIAGVMEGSSYIAAPGFSTLLVLILTLISFFAKRPKGINPKALMIPFFFVLMTLAEIYGKTVVEHPAPPFTFIKKPATVFPPEYINEQYSYPSGHAARAIYLGAVMSYGVWVMGKRNGRLFTIICGIGLITYVFLVSVSRIYLGHHWLSDVIGGLLLGLAAAFIAIGLTLSLDGKQIAPYNT